MRTCRECPERATFMVSIAHQLRNAQLTCARHLARAIREAVAADGRERPANVRVL